VRGGDARLYHKSWDGAQWSAWQDLGGILTSGPSVASWASGRLDVFVRGTDGAVWHKWSSGGTVWSGWDTLGGIITSDPGVVSSTANRIDIFGKGTDNALWQISWNGTAWTSWQSLGGILTSGPAAASCASGHLDLFMLGSDYAVYHRGFTGTWGAWQRMGGQWPNSPGAVCSPGTTTITVAERALDSTLWDITLAGS
jgi:hypothetical protein